MVLLPLELGYLKLISIQEDQLRAGGEEKFAHLNEDLHVMIEASGTKALAQARLAAGVAELRKMMIPGVWLIADHKQYVIGVPMASFSQ